MYKATLPDLSKARKVAQQDILNLGLDKIAYKNGQSSLGKATNRYDEKK